MSAESARRSAGFRRVNAADAVMCRRYFLWVYWTRKRSEGKKMNNDGYMVLSAGEIDKVLGLW